MQRVPKPIRDPHFLVSLVPSETVAAILETPVDLEPVSRDRLEDELRPTKENLQATIEAMREQIERRDRFLATLSHELRNPLAVIDDALRLIDRWLAQAPDNTHKPLEIIRRQSQHMQRLIDDLLDVSRVTQGKVRLRKQAIDLCAALRDLIDQRLAQIEERGLNLEHKLAEEGTWIYGDPARIVQIFDNLISNAIKYTPPGGLIEIDVRREGETGVSVHVRDDGAGIDREIQAHIFEMYVQADATLDRSRGGLGVGLTVVRQLVELHEGRIEVLSEGLGKGSEFVIHFPTSPSPSAA